MAQTDEHPADLLILGKAKERAASIQGNSEGSSPMHEQSRRKGSKRKRSQEIALNLQYSDDDMEVGEVGVRAESKDVNGRPDTKSKDVWRAPIGVTVIADDEEEVQLGMQKAMRMPRYFTKRSFGGSAKKCFNCGQQGHFNRDCPNARQERPCYLCAKFGHSDTRCPASKVRCYKCNRLGHLSRDCPYPQNALAIPMICTRCGDPDCHASGQPDWVRAEGGCSKPYFPGDLAVIRCYVCHKKGHLSCKRTTAPAASHHCFNCGKAGHLGHECQKTPTYLASMEKREASNQRGLDELRSSDSLTSDSHRAAKRHRPTQPSTSSYYWKEKETGPDLRQRFLSSTPQDSSRVDNRTPAAVPNYAPNYNIDSERFRYDTLPPVQHPQPPPIYPPAFEAQPLPSQQYGHVQYQQPPGNGFGQGLQLGGFTMGYAPPQPQRNQLQSNQYYGQNGLRR